MAVKTNLGRWDLVGRAIDVRLAVVEPLRRPAITRPAIVEKLPLARSLPDETRLDDLPIQCELLPDLRSDGENQLSISVVSIVVPGGK